VLPESAPVAVECLPAPQSEHAAEPRAALWDTQAVIGKQKKPILFKVTAKANI
jgi:hypothetical protein